MITSTDTKTGTRRAGTGDRSRVNEVLAAAFREDPVFAWLLPDRIVRHAILTGVFDTLAEAFARHGETYVSDHSSGVEGVAIWAPPGAEPIHPDDEPAFVARLTDLTGADMERFIVCSERFADVHPSEPAWYLPLLGVDAGRQGQGVGSRLLRAVLRGADDRGEAAYLEATSERNRALYERHGFTRITEIVLPDGPAVYPMWRDPRRGKGI